MNISSTKLAVKIGARSIWRNPRRSFLTLIAVAFGVWSAISLSAVARGVSQQMIDNAVFNLTGHIKLQKSEYLDDPVIEHSFSLNAEELTKIETVAAQYALRLKVPATIMSERHSTGVNLLGIDSAQEKGLSFVGEGVASGKMLDDPDSDGIILGKKLATLLETALGKRIVVLSQHINGQLAERGFRVVGIFDAELEMQETSYAYIGRSVMQKLLGVEGKISELSIKLSDVQKLGLVLAELKQAFPTLKVADWQELQPLSVALHKIQDGFLIIWFGIVVVAISFGVVNTLFMSIFERVREFGLLQALGMNQKLVVLQVVTESIWLIIIAVIIGTLAALGTVLSLQDGIDLSNFAAGTEFVGIKSIVIPKIVLKDWLTAISMVVGVSALATLYPAFRAARYSPVEALGKGG